jgi:dTDP-4-dehydrorhamnose 3,5-epimerase
MSQPMGFRPFDLPGPLEIQPSRIADERGYFSEIFRLHEFSKHVPGVEFVQENQSLSVGVGTLRGIHFQAPPATQGKLVRCLAGAIFDVAVDLQQESPTFGKWIAVVLSSDKNNQLWIPAGFGHAFCTLEANSIVSYRVTAYYSSSHDKGLAWNDPDVAIEWPDIANPESLSTKDRNLPRLAELPAYFSMKEC